ncbi:myb-like DNA-binding protein bas1 [Coemansia pectinata]|uniref:Myb-like DNA-binding protein bas1 n=1 Tax=Coemansia pectinata TaxID=1052879 RepID=A0A9W8H0V6_9FUNG|nr:myb-like DNA-binding protein bas1 [Coemansia pectinata]
MPTTTSASAGNEKRKRIGANNSATAAAFVVTPTDSYNDDALPNEAEINTMDVAKLRQVMLNIVRVRKPTLSPTPVESPSVPSYSSSNAALSSTASERSAELGDSAVPAGNSALQARKRYRNDSDASDASQRMGIDLLLNASTFSDRYNRSSYQLSMSPSSYSEYRSSPPAICLSSSPPAHRFLPSDTADSYWRDSHKPFSLPPISQLEIRSSSDPTGPGSPPSDCSFGVSSLEGYRIGPRSAKDTYSYAHSFPPPLSTTRSLASITQHRPSPPISQHSSPTTYYPNLQGPPSAASRSEPIPVPASAAAALPHPSDNLVYADAHQRQPYSSSPPRALCTQPSQSPQQQQQQQHLQPRPQQSPPNPSHVSFSQAQSYFAQQQVRPHAISPPSQQPQTPSQTQAQAQPIPINPGLAVGVVRNISKPKFNYAFLDTKRPRGPSSRWSPDEDELLKSAVREHGEDRQWVKVAQHVPGRTNLQCRQRWLCNIKAQVEKERGVGQA